MWRIGAGIPRLQSVRSGRAPGTGIFVGRRHELDLLHNVVTGLSNGRGGAVWIEGEPGIGKSALVAEGLRPAPEAGCELSWGLADELTLRFPLQVILDCLAIEARSTDPARAGIAAMLRGDHGGGLVSSGNPVLAVAERLLALVDELCARGPMILVVDDLHWADEASLAVWRRLAGAVAQIPLLLVAACRPVPRRDEVRRVRQEIVDGNGVLISLGPLPSAEVGELVTGIVGMPPGPRLRRLSDQAAGNPLYLHEMVGALLREHILRIDTGVAELAVESGYEAPATIIAAVARRLDFLSEVASGILRIAALMGPDFAVDEMAAVSGVAPSELGSALEEAVVAGVLAEVETARLAFRHPLIRHVFHDQVPTPMRGALHRHAAQVLAELGAPVERVATHLASTTVVDAWVVDWLSTAAASLVSRAPQIAAELLERAVEQTPTTDPHWEVLAAALPKAVVRLGRDGDAEKHARAALAHARAPEVMAELRWILAYVQTRTGNSTGIGTIGEALGDPAVPPVWAARLQALLAMMQVNFVGDLDLAEATAHGALAQGEAAGDRFAMGHALHAMALISGMRQDNASQAAFIGRALVALDDDVDHVDLRLILHHNRIYALTVMDRIAEAETELGLARRVAEQSGNVQVSNAIHLWSAVHSFWTGRWDDALAELDAIPYPVTNYRLLTSCGLNALMAARRDDLAMARRWLTAVREQPMSSAVERDNSHFVLAARSVVAERDGDVGAALAALAVLLEPEFASVTLRYWLLPDLVRLALAAGDRDTAAGAVDTCAGEAAREATTGKVAAARHCRGLLDDDPAPILTAAGHYRDVGRVTELARALEDAAVLLAAGGETERARVSFIEAVEIYAGLGAAWDVRRADSRVRPYGIRRGARGPRRRPSHGWAALSPTEVSVAHLVARGYSNPRIAAELLLSRRTVQSHVSHILAKLDAHSRIEIARETVRH